MIQTKTAITYGDRSEKTGIIKVEIRVNEVRKDGTEYLVIDWDLSDLSSAIFSKTVFKNKEEIQAIDNYLEANHDFSGMDKVDIEWKKMQLALMLDTQTNLLPSGKTIYRQPVDVWVFSPEIDD